MLSPIGVISLETLASVEDSGTIPGQDGPLASIAALLPHDAILINGNSGFTNASGVTWGSGTESDPYVIEGWDISALAASGIEILNTDAHFVVRSCLVHGSTSPYSGIRLGSCVNGTLDNNSLSSNYYGIYLESSSGNAISKNNCSNNWYGIFLSGSSSDNTLCNNNCSNNKYDGIELYYQCNNNTICNNTFLDNLDGIHLESSYGNTLANNVMVNNGMSIVGYLVSECNTHDIDTSNTVNGRPLYFYRDQSGITVPTGAGQILLANCTDFIIEGQNLEGATVGVELAFSSNITIRNNTFLNNTYGIFLWFSDGNTVSDNAISNNEVSSDNWWYGIGLRYSNDNNITNNTCSDSLYGLGLGPSSSNNTIGNNSCTNNTSGIALVLSSNNNTLMNNTFSYNSQHGILLQSSSNNTFTGNNLSYNTKYAIDLFLSSDNNRIWNNTFISNNGAGDIYDWAHVQAYDDGTGNCWNSTDGYGNFWSDWRGPDLSPMDGIVDYPYRIGGSAGTWDFYPIAEYYGTPIPEFGAMLLTVVGLVIMLAVIMVKRRQSA